MKIFMLDEDDPRVPVVANNLVPGSGRYLVIDEENVEVKT